MGGLALNFLKRNSKLNNNYHIKAANCFNIDVCIHIVGTASISDIITNIQHQQIAIHAFEPSVSLPNTISY